MKVKLIGGSKDKQTIICPDDTLVLVYPKQDRSRRFEDQEKYYVSHGIGLTEKN